MSLYRCSACGSPNVVTASENGGYSYSKGIAGAIVFGAPGAVAGINGKSKQVFKCPDCGLTTDSPMVNDIKMMIDLGLMSEFARNNLTLNGAKIDWDTLTGRYKNIEKSHVDNEIAKKEAKKQSSIANDKRILEQKATATQKEFDEAIDTFFNIKAKDGYFKKEDCVYTKQNPIPKEEFESGIKSIFTIIENFYKHIPPHTYNRKAKYRGQDIYLDDLFNEYVILRYYSLTAMPFPHTKRTIEYVLESDPFIGAFIRQYSMDGDAKINNCYNFNGWMIINGKIHTTHNFTYGMNFLVRCNLKECGNALGRYKTFIGYDLEEIWLPRFTIINDKLCYWEESFKAPQQSLKINFDDLKNTYFKKHKEKKTQFNEFLKSTDALFDRYESFESELNSIPSKKESEKVIDNLNNKNKNIKYQIAQNDTEIDRLGRKIFFKTKANEQISELRMSNDKLYKQLNENNESIKKLKDKIEDDVEAYNVLRRLKDNLKQELLTETLQQLFGKMNNFIDWIVAE